MYEQTIDRPGGAASEETMGFGGISIWQLLIILVIVLLLFGTKRLKSIGSDLGNAVRGFRSAMSESEKEDDEPKKLEETSVERSDGSGKVAGAATTKEKEKV